MSNLFREPEGFERPDDKTYPPGTFKPDVNQSPGSNLTQVPVSADVEVD